MVSHRRGDHSQGLEALGRQAVARAWVTGLAYPLGTRAFRRTVTSPYGTGPAPCGTIQSVRRHSSI